VYLSLPYKVEELYAREWEGTRANEGKRWQMRGRIREKG